MHKMASDKKAFAYLQIEQGVPYKKGTRIPLDGDAFMIGRSTTIFSVDVSFGSFLISRKHCYVKYSNSEWIISDLGSKHGTRVNDECIAEQEEYVLKSGDKVILSSGIVMFSFVMPVEFDKTLDFDRTHSIKIEDDLTFDPYVNIDLDRMKLLVDNQVISLSVKEWLFLETLYRRRGKVVSYEDIKRAVWPERYIIHNNFSVVGFEEVNMMSYRLRKKIGKYSKIIKTIRGHGCMLDL